MRDEYPEYCSGNYDFIYSAEFNYSNTQCEMVNAFEVATKLPQTVAIATVYLDITEEGWPCSAADAAVRQAACLAANGAPFAFFGSQCGCTSRATTYPVGTEAMSVVFEHAFSTTEVMDRLTGSSALTGDSLAATTVTSVEYALALEPRSTLV